MQPYFTLIIRFTAQGATKWHPTDPKHAPLSRGAFPTRADARQWAAENLAGAPADSWGIKRIDPDDGSVTADPAPAPAPLRGIRLYVYRWGLGDCTNGGASSNVKTITVVDSGIPGADPAGPDAPAFRLVTRTIAGRPYSHLEPVDAPEGRVGPMMGGNYAGGGGGGWRERYPYPLPIHDRFETIEQYRAMAD